MDDTCLICGEEVDNRYTCVKCGADVCEDCYDFADCLCYHCENEEE